MQYAGFASKPFISLVASRRLIATCCRQVHDADPVGWAKKYPTKRDRSFEYGPKTGTTALRGHIERYHLVDYLSLAETNRWPILLKSVKSAQSCGHKLREIRDALMAGRSIASLAQSVSRTLPAQAPLAKKTSPMERAADPPASLKKIHDQLIELIVVNRQVRSSSFRLFYSNM